jgi:hypothetical protein
MYSEYARRTLCSQIYHARKNTSILAFLELGLPNIPAPLPNGLPPMPSGLPPTPDANFLPAKPDELLGLCCTGVENVPRDDVVEDVNCLCAGEGVPNETERGDSARDGVSRGDGLVPEGEALYRGGVIVSFIVVAMGVISIISQSERVIPVLSSPISSRCAGVRGIVVRGRDFGLTRGNRDRAMLYRNNARNVHEII